MSLYGAWHTPAKQYAADVSRYVSEIGLMEWAAIQDWMCEPFMVQKTGLSVYVHQCRTITSYEQLMALNPSLPWMPVLQGYTLADYLRHVEMYDVAGINLWQCSVVGIGSVCRRQGTVEVAEIVRRLAGLGLRLHGFGMKTLGLMRSHPWLVSSDSLAWSFRARRQSALPGHPHRSCANCLSFALAWRGGLLRQLGRLQAMPTQLWLCEEW